MTDFEEGEVKRIYVPGVGNPRAELMFVGEAPGATEEYLRQPFVGPSGELLWEICREVGIDKREVYVTNVSKYRPPNNQIFRLKEIGVDINKCIDQLWEEIQAINPTCIVALGNTPLRALCKKDKILRWRGSILKSSHLDFKVVPTIHPAALLHSSEEEGEEGEGKLTKKGPLKYSYRHVLKLDLRRALEESKTKIYDVPDRVLEIARDSVQLGRFLDLYKDREKYPIVSVDIEVVRSIPFCIAIAFSNWHAISVPLLDVFSWQNLSGIQDHQLAEMWMLVARLLESDVKVIGQNFKFDQRQLANLGIYISNFYCDTSLLANAIHPEFPKALEFNTSIYTREPYYKDEGREFDWKKDKIDRFLLYNARDAAITYEVYEEMIKDARELSVPGFPDWINEFVFDHQMLLHEFYYELEDIGFKINHKMQADLVKLYDTRLSEAKAELQALAGWDVNPASPKQLAILLYNQLKFPRRKGTGEEVIVALLANTKKITSEMQQILELILKIRRLKIAKDKVGAKVDYDGRMKSGYTPCGTETGRSSTKQLRPPVRPEKIGMPFHTITKHGDIGTEIREMFEADDGYVLVETDMSQAEARIVALLAHDKKLLDLFARKEDIHKLTASWIFSVPVSNVTTDLRFIGKMTRHAGNYDMGKHRLMELVNTEAKRYHLDVNISEWKAGKILDAFHSFSPQIRQVYHQEVQRCLQGNNRVLVNPFGRYRQFFDRWGRELFKEAYAQIPQSTVPDHIRRAGIRSKVRFKEGGIDARFILEGHDSLVSLVRKDQVQSYLSIVHTEIEKPIDFSRCTISRGSLIIPAESKVGLNYKDYSKTNPSGLKLVA